jgi:hypothetical protein
MGHSLFGDELESIPGLVVLDEPFIQVFVNSCFNSLIWEARELCQRIVLSPFFPLVNPGRPDSLRYAEALEAQRASPRAYATNRAGLHFLQNGGRATASDTRSANSVWVHAKR